MGRLRHFPGHRYVGTRDTMTVYDCDDPDQFEELSERVELDDLVGRTLVQSFAPDTEAEARSRGFRSPRRAVR